LSKTIPRPVRSRRRSSLTDLLVALQARGVPYTIEFDPSDQTGMGPYFMHVQGVGLAWCQSMFELLEICKEWHQRIRDADG